MASLLQWNCRGLRANFNELLILIQNHNPVAIALQELAIPHSYSFQNRHYSLFSSLPLPSGTRSHGGAGILIQRNIPHSPLPLNTSLQAVACRISIPQPITVCSIYLPRLAPGPKQTYLISSHNSHLLFSYSETSTPTTRCGAALRPMEKGKKLLTSSSQVACACSITSNPLTFTLQQGPPAPLT